MKIVVHAKPNAKVTRCTGRMMDEPTFMIALHAQPIDGAANHELILFLSNVLSVPKSSIHVLRGESAKTKTVELPDGTDLTPLFP